MIKSWGGDGYVKNVLFENFLSHNTAYGLDVNQYWSSQTQAAGNGVALSNITFSVSPILASEFEGFISTICFRSTTGLGWCRRRRSRASSDSVLVC